MYWPALFAVGIATCTLSCSRRTPAPASANPSPNRAVTQVPAAPPPSSTIIATNYAIRVIQPPGGTNFALRVIEPDPSNHYALRFVPH